MKYKLLALDFDGTLLSYGAPDGVSPRVLAALRAAREAGVLLCAATGRSLTEAAPALGCMEGLFHYSVTTNGAQVHRFPDELIASHTFSMEASHAILEVLRGFPGLFLQVFIGAEPYTEEAQFREKRLTPLLDAYARMMGKPLSTTPDFSALIREKGLPCKFFTIAQSPKHAAEIASAINALGIAETTGSATDNVEILPKGVSKVSGVTEVCAAAGVTREEVLAIGDSDNDRAMLSFAGFGVAMGNAPEDVRQAADAVTAGVDEDGAAAAIERYVLGGEAL